MSSVEIEEVRGFLQQQEPFSHVTPSALDALPLSMSMRYVRRGSEVIAAGEVNDTLYIIRTGAVDVISADGALVDRREAGLNFGYSTLVGAPQSQYQFLAVEDCLLLELPRQAFDALCLDNPDVARFFDAQTRRTSAAVRDTTEPLRTKLSDASLRPPITASPQLSIRDAAVLMEREGVSSLLLVDDSGELEGIVTDRDLRGRVVATGFNSDEAVAHIMTRNPQSVAPETVALEALVRMLEKGIHHLPVVEDGRPVALITQSDIARLVHSDPVAAAMDFSARGELSGAFTDAARLAATRGAPGIMTMVADSLVRTLCQRAESKFGAPPVPYAFVAVGSQGRREMGLASDQDNALILDDSYSEIHERYFAQLSQYVCEGLAEAGQSLCPGNMMASNPQWRMTANQWEETFHQWITAPQPDALLHSQVFFDMRAIYGDDSLSRRVHDYAVGAARGSKRLHAHLATLAARREPPLTFFRGLVVERDGEYANTLDIKKGGTAAIVQMARLWALVAGKTAVETAARLSDAAIGGSVSQAGAKELSDALAYLNQLSFEHQSKQVIAGKQPDYHVDPHSLSRLDRERLRDTFRIIKGMQSALATAYPVRNI